jgi:hypothetical protein
VNTAYWFEQTTIAIITEKVGWCRPIGMRTTKQFISRLGREIALRRAHEYADWDRFVVNLGGMMNGITRFLAKMTARQLCYG